MFPKLLRTIFIGRETRILCFANPLTESSSVGRTARAGRGGVAITLISEHDIKSVQAIEEHVGVKMELYDVLNVCHVVERWAHYKASNLLRKMMFFAR